MSHKPVFSSHHSRSEVSKLFLQRAGQYLSSVGHNSSVTLPPSCCDGTLGRSTNKWTCLGLAHSHNLATCTPGDNIRHTILSVIHQIHLFYLTFPATLWSGYCHFHSHFTDVKFIYRLKEGAPYNTLEIDIVGVWMWANSEPALILVREKSWCGDRWGQWGEGWGARGPPERNLGEMLEDGKRI